MIQKYIVNKSYNFNNANIQERIIVIHYDHNILPKGIFPPPKIIHVLM